MGEVSASKNVAGNLVQELEQLAGQTKRTAEEQNRMQGIVMQLNTMFPEMGLELDKVSGKLNMSSEEMKGFIDSSIEMQKMQVVQEKMTKSVEKLVDAQIEEAEAAKKLKGINDKLKNIDSKRTELNDAITKQSEEAREAQEKYSEALREGADNVNELYAATMNQKEVTIEYNGEVMTTMEALQRMAEDEQDLKKLKKDYTQAQKDANDAIEKANEQMEPYMQYLNGMADATKKVQKTLQKTQKKKQRQQSRHRSALKWLEKKWRRTMRCHLSSKQWRRM